MTFPLTYRCVQELELEAGRRMAIEIQFQMDRLQFCQMHYAVDLLNNSDIVFPDYSKMAPAWNERHTLHIT